MRPERLAHRIALLLLAFAWPQSAAAAQGGTPAKADAWAYAAHQQLHAHDRAERLQDLAKWQKVVAHANIKAGT